MLMKMQTPVWAAIAPNVLRCRVASDRFAVQNHLQFPLIGNSLLSFPLKIRGKQKKKKECPALS